MKACIVLAGGKGSRLKPVWRAPKILAPVHGELLFLNLLVDKLSTNGFQKIHFALGAQADPICKQLLKISTPAKLSWSIEGKPLGTGGAFLESLRYLDLHEVWVINGDTCFSGDFPKQILSSEQLGYVSDLMLLVKKIENNDRYGGVKVLEDELSFVRGEDLVKQTDFPVFLGFARVRSCIFFDLDVPPPVSFEELLSLAFKKKKFQIELVEYAEDFLDFGIPSDYAKLPGFFGF